MKRAKFIKKLVVEDVVLRNPEVLQYHDARLPNFFVADDDSVAFTETLNTVPVHRLSEITGGVRRDVFIAYSKEVQDFLEMPFDVLRKENELLDDQCRHLRHLLCSVETASFWERLVYLFTSEIPGV